jgi:hypothetical protein
MKIIILKYKKIKLNKISKFIKNLIVNPMRKRSFLLCKSNIIYFIKLKLKEFNFVIKLILDAVIYLITSIKIKQENYQLIVFKKVES